MSEIYVSFTLGNRVSESRRLYLLLSFFKKSNHHTFMTRFYGSINKNPTKERKTWLLVTKKLFSKKRCAT